MAVHGTARWSRWAGSLPVLVALVFAVIGLPAVGPPGLTGRVDKSITGAHIVARGADGPAAIDRSAARTAGSSTLHADSASAYRLAAPAGARIAGPWAAPRRAPADRVDHWGRGPPGRA